MDIPKYIGLFLVKNKYVSLTGLGTLELAKRSAIGTADGLEAPKYDIKFKNLSSIDDQFPNFIGVQENISSNNATNAISRFSKEVKATIANGQPYVLDGIGRFVGQGDKIGFQPVSEFDAGEFMIMPPIATPAFESDNTRNANDKPVNEVGSYGYTAAEPKSFSIGKIVVPILALVALAALIYFGYNFMQGKKEKADSDIVAADTVNNATAPIAADTTSTIDTTVQANGAVIDTVKTAGSVPPTPNDSTKKAVADTAKTAPAFVGPAMNIVTRTYSNQASADVYAKKLKGYGRNTSVKMLDSTNYQVIISLDKTDKPAADVINEIRANYNPGEKFGKVEAAR